MPDTPTSSWRKTLIGWLGWAMFLISWAIYALGGFQGPPPGPPPMQVQPEPVAPVVMEGDAPQYFGWDPDPGAVMQAFEELGRPKFDATPAFQGAAFGDADDVFLWDAPKKVTGSILPSRNQGGVGSCVSFGTASAIEHLLCVQIANGGRRELYKDLIQEVIYGGSRVEIGGGKIRGDGSIGAWAAKFVSQYGVLPRGTYGNRDLSRYSESTCREYGSRGVPDELEPQVKQHPVKSVALVKSWDECKAAIRNGYPIAVCSNQGFRMERDGEGFCSPRGTWYHCMAIIGIRGGNRPGAFILNSWGPNAHTGPRWPADAPPAGFWADASTVDRMLKQGDSWAFSDATGFPRRRLDWNVRAEPRGLPLGFDRPLFALAP